MRDLERPPHPHLDPLHGRCITEAILLMPFIRGSRTGSGVLQDLSLTGRGPAALIFCKNEDVLTLDALIAAEMFGQNLVALRLSAKAFRALSAAQSASIDATRITADDLKIPITPPAVAALDLTPTDRPMLEGNSGDAVQHAMRIVCAMAALSVDRSNWQTQGVPPIVRAARRTFGRRLCADGLPAQFHLLAVPFENSDGDGR